MKNKKSGTEPLSDGDLDNVQGGGIKNIGSGGPYLKDKVKRKAPAGPGDKDGKGDKLEEIDENFGANSGVNERHV